MLLNDVCNDNIDEIVNKFINAKIKFIFGRNIYTEELINKVDGISGIIDDFYDKKEYLGLPIIKLEDLPQDSYICVVSGGNILTSLHRVKSLGFNNVIHYVDLLKYSKINFIHLVFNENFKEVFDNCKKQFINIYNLLNDSISQEIYRKIISFRYYYNINFLQGFKNREKEQYFEEFLELKNNEIFLDIGGYDGFTSLEFIKRVGDYKKIYFFEPDIQNLNKAEQLLKKHEDIEFLNLGAYDKNDTLKFSSKHSASSIDENGDSEIKVCKVDDYIDEKITFIKMDIEGAEQKALIGAKNIIKKYKPKMAISIYHSPYDFFRIPEKIFEIVGEGVYDIYVRHYTESIYETIMFFIPKKKIFDNKKAKA